jgi:hypothetical protein
MKLIGAVSGIAAIRVPSEEIMSPHGGPLQNTVDLIAATFAFPKPILQPAPVNSPAQDFSTLTFQNGEIDIGGQSAAVFTLIQTPDGVMAACRRTEISDMVLDRLSEVLDTNFNSRYREVTRSRLHLSTVVVQFESAFLHNLDPIASISEIVTRYIDPKTRDARFVPKNFNIKHLSFGTEAGNVQTPNPFEQLERADFMIEARVQHDLSENVFFSSAPLTTDAHLEALANIEAVTMSRRAD